MSSSVHAELIEDSAVIKVFLLCGAPGPKHLLESKERHGRELLQVPGGGLRLGGAIEIPADDVLAFIAVQEVEVGLGEVPRAMGQRHFFDDRHGWLCENAFRRGNDLE